MCRAIRAGVMSATILAITALTGCGKERLVRVPVVQPVIVEKPMVLPDRLVAPCPITYKERNTVREAVRIANYNTHSLEGCAGQIDEIRKLNDEAKKKAKENL